MRHMYDWKQYDNLMKFLEKHVLKKRKSKSIS